MKKKVLHFIEAMRYTYAQSYISFTVEKRIEVQNKMKRLVTTTVQQRRDKELDVR